VSLSYTVFIAIYWSKIADTLPLFSAPVGGGPSEFCRDFGTRKLESLGYRMALFVWSHV